MNVATRSEAAVANHFSCSRSSPTDPRNRTTTATSERASALRTGRANRSRPSRGLFGEVCPNGSFHACVTKMRLVPQTSAKGTTHVPCDRSPPSRSQVARREQQEEEGEHAQGDQSDPVACPSEETARWERPGVRHKGMDPIGQAQCAEAQREPRSQKQPPDRILRSSRREDDADGGDAHVHNGIEDVREGPLLAGSIGRQRGMATDEHQRERADDQRDREGSDRPGQSGGDPRSHPRRRFCSEDEGKGSVGARAADGADPHAVRVLPPEPEGPGQALVLTEEAAHRSGLNGVGWLADRRG
jgi:hypothetical protein